MKENAPSLTSENPNIPNTSKTPELVGLIIALGLTTLFWWPGIASRLLPEDLVSRNVASQLADWFVCLLLIAIVLLWERRPLSSLGFKPLTWSNLAAGLGLGGFFMVGMVIWKLLENAFFPELSASSSQSGGASASEFPDHFFLWFTPFALLTASICEEVIYRGYAMERLMRFTNQKWIIILLPHIAFALMHLKDGIDKPYLVLVMGILFPLFYYKYRDLTMLIVAHFFIDSLAVLGHLAGIEG